MAAEEHFALLRAGVERWNHWREKNRSVCPDLSGAYLFKADLRRANLSSADLSGAVLIEADLRGANLSNARLFRAYLSGASLDDSNLSRADMKIADLFGATMNMVNLREADLREANLRSAFLHGADLSGTNLNNANLSDANLSFANLNRANLSEANLVRTDLRYANLTGCQIYGASVWDVQLKDTIQASLRIAPICIEVYLTSDVRLTPSHHEAPEITVDDLEVAQFLYLMLHNEKIRKVIDTVTSKVVLILGRFTEPRKQVLDALRNSLRTHNYVPVLFDFDGPANASTTETVSLLARMARFVIADLTEPGSVPWELAKIVPNAHVPVQTLLLEGATTFTMAPDLWRDNPNLMLPIYRYATIDQLLATLNERIIEPAEARVKELQRQRTMPIDGLS